MWRNCTQDARTHSHIHSYMLCLLSSPYLLQWSHLSSIHAHNHARTYTHPSPFIPGGHISSVHAPPPKKLQGTLKPALAALATLQAHTLNTQPSAPRLPLLPSLPACHTPFSPLCICMPFFSLAPPILVLSLCSIQCLYCLRVISDLYFYLFCKQALFCHWSEQHPSCHATLFLCL